MDITLRIGIMQVKQITELFPSSDQKIKLYLARSFEEMILLFVKNHAPEITSIMLRYLVNANKSTQYPFTFSLEII